MRVLNRFNFSYILFRPYFQGILTAVISYLTGSNDPQEVGVMAKQATEVRFYIRHDFFNSFIASKFFYEKYRCCFFIYIMSESVSRNGFACLTK